MIWTIFYFFLINFFFFWKNAFFACLKFWKFTICDWFWPECKKSYFSFQLTPTQSLTFKVNFLKSWAKFLKFVTPLFPLQKSYFPLTPFHIHLGSSLYHLTTWWKIFVLSFTRSPPHIMFKKNNPSSPLEKHLWRWNWHTAYPHLRNPRHFRFSCFS